GDPIGAASGANLLHAVRLDGVIVKPDVPLTPVDSSYGNMAHGVDTAQIASTYSDFGALRTYYVFAYAPGSSLQASNLQTRFRLADLGVHERVYLYDYFGGSGQVGDPSGVVEKP